MITTKLTLTDYLALETGSEQRSEFVGGKIIEMPPESEEYAARGIGEYWIIDPARKRVTVLTLVDGLYEAEEIGEGAVLKSPQFPELTLKVSQVLKPEV